MRSTTDFLSRLETVLEGSKGELARAQQELREIDLLIRQSTAEVERLAQRNSQQRAQVAAMEANLDNYARDEIKSTYTAERESQLRLFVMRSQVEQLQNKQRLLERLVEELQHYMALSKFLPSREELMEMEQAALERAATARAAPSQARVIEAQEEERLALVRQMHDGPVQSLTNLILHAEICERLFDSDVGRAREELANLKRFATSTFQRVRDFIFELRPMMLDDLGLAPTLRRYLATFEEKERIGVSFQLAGQERRIPGIAEITLFRAVQELIHTAAHQAQATSVQVVLDLQEEAATVLLEHNGAAFDIAQALTSSDGRDQQDGLSLLRERVEMAGGYIAAERGVGRGTRVAITVPFTEESPHLLLS
jgi:two-component system, NarL family, sensor histidine kinase DegS